jgi:hypothetical protein
MPRAYVTSRGRTGVSFGCLGTVVIGFLYLMGILLLVALVACLIGVWVLVLLGAWAAMGIDRLLVATSPKWKARRSAVGQFNPVLWLTSKTHRATHRARRAVPQRSAQNRP